MLLAAEGFNLLPELTRLQHEHANHRAEQTAGFNLLPELTRLQRSGLGYGWDVAVLVIGFNLLPELTRLQRLGDAHDDIIDAVSISYRS